MIKRAPAPSLRIHQALAKDLAVAILTGKLKPGELLAGEIAVAKDLDVSRTAYREASRILTAKGLLESRPKTGTRVTERHHWNLLDPEILAWMFSGKPDEGFVRDLFELRGVIEPFAAELAAKRRTQAHLEAMRAALSVMEAKTLKSAEGREADQLFHRNILKAAGNEALLSLSSSVEAAVAWTTKFKYRKRSAMRDPILEHVAVYQAISAGKPRAARAAMVDLVEKALADMGIAAD